MTEAQERMDREYAEFYAKTGELIREWAELEAILAWPISALLGTDEFRARVLLGAIRSFDAKRRLILQLSATYAGDETHNAIVGLLQRAKNLARNRNMLAHQFGGVDEKPNSLIFLSDSVDEEIGTNFLSKRKISQSNISTWIKEIAELRGEIMQMFSQRGSVTIFRDPKMHRKEKAEAEANAKSQDEGEAG